MASRYEISTIFKMIDNFSGAMKSIAGSSSVMAKKVSADMQKTKMQIQAAGRAMKAMAGVAVAGGVAAAGAFVGKSLQNYTEFDEAMHGAGAAFSDLANLNSDAFEKKLKDVGVYAREVAASTEFDMIQAAEGLKAFAQAGVKSDAAVVALRQVADFATAAGSDLSEGTGLMLNSLNTLGMFTDVPEVLSKNMKRLSDVMAYTANSAKMTVVDVAEAIKIGGAGFTKENQNINDMSAAITALASKGFVGSEAGNALKNIMTKMVGLTPEATKALQRMGITTVDSQGNMLNFIDIISQFEKATAGMGDAEIDKNFKAIFGLENITQFKAILGTGSEALRQFSKEAANSGGATAGMAERIRGSFGNQLKVLNSELTELGAKIAETFLDNGGTDFIGRLTDFIHNFDVAPIAGALTKIMQAIPGIVEGFVGFVQTLWNMRDVIGTLVIAWGIYKGAVIAALVIEKMMAFFSAIKAVQAATQGMSIAQAALNVVMNANPIGLVITAIAALGLGIYELIKHWDEVKSAVLNFCSVAWEKIQAFGGAVGDFFNGMWQGITDGIASMIESCGSFFSWVWDKVLSIADGIKNTFLSIWGAISGFVNMVKTSVINIGKSVLTALIDPIISALDAMSGLPFVGDWIGDRRDDLKSFRDSINSTVDTSLSLSEPVTTAPVTQGERTAYSVMENNNNTSTEVTVTLDKGLKGSASGNAPNVTVQSVSSAAWK